MSLHTSETESENETLSALFSKGLSIHDSVCADEGDTNSATFQEKVRKGIMILEDATRLVSILDLFSRNEHVRDIPTESLKFFLLPVLLGNLNSKLTDETDRRLQMIVIIETYYLDFLNRVKDYSVMENIEIPKIRLSDNDECNETSIASNPLKPDLAKMNKERDEKIKKYKQKKELEAQLKELKVLVVDLDKDHRDEELVRKYYLKMIHSFVLSTMDEIASYEMEKSMLHHMAKIRRGEVPDTQSKNNQVKRPLKPIVITRDAVQKEVFGMGYKHLPILTIEEFYEQRVRDGWFPSPEETKKQNSLLNRAMTDSESARNQEDEEARLKELKEENDDEEELESKRRMDAYKDEHKRVEGNRHNMG